MSNDVESPRVACVVVSGLPLQILLRDRPEWRGHPLAVVEEDHPSARLVAVDAHARKAGLREGMRYGPARSLVQELRAAPVPERRVQEVADDLLKSLTTFSPRVEPVDGLAGAFHLDPSGLERIYGGAQSWTTAVHQYLQGRCLRNAVVAGFGRFATMSLALSRGRGASVLASPAAERRAARAVRLDACAGAFPTGALDALDKLGVRTLGALADLSATEVHARLGAETALVRALAAGELGVPLRGVALPEPIVEHAEIDPPDDDRTRILFVLKGAIDRAITAAARRVEILTAFDLELGLDVGKSAPVRSVIERVAPAAPTRDTTLLADLVRLRLAALAIPGPVASVTVRVETMRCEGDQLALFRTEGTRDLDAAARALARVRAAFGPKSVTRARVRDAHLPEAQFAFEEIVRPTLPRVQAANEGTQSAPPPLVRRLLRHPKPLASRDPGDPARGPALDAAAELKLYGPYRLSGGWWAREVERDYYWAETGTGDLYWVYYDRPRQGWYLHGVVD